jgi:predicted nucleic acid-binding protein
MHILDTNVISELFRPTPEPAVGEWLGMHSPSQFFVTAISKAESLLGLALMPEGRRRQQLDDALRVFFEERLRTPILAFGDKESAAFAQLVAARRSRGLPIGEFDAQIAAIARTHGYAVVTRNVSDFAHCGVEIINPWEAG